MRSLVGNGMQTFFWFDHWLHLGPLINLFSVDRPRSTCIPITAKVADVCDGNGWIMRPSRSDASLAIQIHLTTIPLPSQADYRGQCWLVCWRSWLSRVLCLKNMGDVRPRQEELDWTDLVWFKGAVPKHSFHMWVLNLKRLPTRQRLHAWGVTSCSDCWLCVVCLKPGITCSFPAPILRVFG